MPSASSKNVSTALPPVAEQAGAAENIHPIFERVLSRAEKEKRLRQRARVIWLFGLSGSGKSTLAIALERQLAAEGFTTHLLDGDNLRAGLNRGLGFSDADRTENIRRAAEVARLFVQAGIVTIAAFITPFRALRDTAREIVGAADFFPVHVHASFATCARRDPKGIYAKAAAAGVANFTGRDSRFEPPAPDEAALLIDTGTASPEAALGRLHAAVRARVAFVSE
jgi:adenylylsulfate kinase